MVLAVLGAPASAQTLKQDQPGFNLFSVQQDVEIGRASAIEAEKQLPILNDRFSTNYLNRIIARLAAQAPGARYPYSAKIVNGAEINAFALPGGPMYVYRGLMESARSEAELAGVLAHEMSHVALRHGTHQASKAYMAEAGLGLLGGLFGKPSGSTSQIVNTIGGVGLNAVFLKFSRDDEYQADRAGAQMMARAGYDPMAMATLFEMLQSQQQSEPGKVAQFFSSHPPPSDRSVRIRQMASNLGSGQPQVLGGYDNVKARLGRLGPASGSISTGTVGSVTVEDQTGAPATVTVPTPSTRLARFRQANGFFTVDYPNNWRPTASGYAVTLAPTGGVTTNSSGQAVLLYGVIVNHYVPFEGISDRWNSSLQRNYAPFEDRSRPRRALEDATDDLVRQILTSNTYLTAQTGSAELMTIDGEEGYSLVLSGRSPVTGLDERVTVYTRSLPDGHVIYALAISPSRDAAALERTFTAMVQSLRVNDNAAHRAVTAANPQP